MKYFIFITLCITFFSCSKKVYFYPELEWFLLDVKKTNSRSYRIVVAKTQPDISESSDLLIKLNEDRFKSLCSELNSLNYGDEKYTGWSNHPSTVKVLIRGKSYYLQHEVDKLEDVLFQYIKPDDLFKD